VPFFKVWPAADNPELDRPGSPGVTRRGDRLEFTDTRPFSARHTSPDRQGHRVSFGGATPDDDPESDSWEHYGPDSVVLHSARKGTTTFTPSDFERNARLGFFVLMFVQNLILATVFFFVVAALLRVKRVVLPSFGALHVLARCLIPACAYFAILMIFGTRLTATLAICAFLVVLGMNALLFVLTARPAPEPGFDV
jgi:hypothetical protein